MFFKWNDISSIQTKVRGHVWLWVKGKKDCWCEWREGGYYDVCRCPFAVSNLPSSFLPFVPNAVVNTNASFKILWRLPFSICLFKTFAAQDFCHCDFCHPWNELSPKCHTWPFAVWDKCRFGTFALSAFEKSSFCHLWQMPCKTFAFLRHLPF